MIAGYSVIDGDGVADGLGVGADVGVGMFRLRACGFVEAKNGTKVTVPRLESFLESWIV